MAAAVVVVAIGGALLWWLAGDFGEEPQEVAQDQPEDPILAIPTGPSIAVLPFDNLSGDSEQNYFVQGLTQDMVTGLARYPDFFVFAYETTSQITDEGSAAIEAARELGADFVVRGNVRKADDTIRVAANLWDVSSGKALWGETYDRDLTARSLFEVQDEITAAVVSTLGEWSGIIQRVQLDQERTLPTDSLQAYECVLRSVEYYDAHTPDKHAEVRECAERAVKLDPEYSMAWALLSVFYLDEARYEFNPRPNALDRALEAGRRAIELDRDNAFAWMELAKIHFHRHEMDSFLAAAEETLKLDSNSSYILADIGLYLVHSGSTERGMPLVRKAMQLNPKHQSWYWFAPTMYHFQRREYEDALTSALRINMQGFYMNHAILASIYGQLSRA
jgi:adenylate cyclase